MTNIFPKFIIEDGNLIIGKVEFHKHLVVDKDKCVGGGWWKINDGICIFSGESIDFGPAPLSLIKKAVEEKKVFTSPALVNNISDKYKFKYQTSYGQSFELN